LIQELSNHLILDEEPIMTSTGKFDGMTFCITGTLSQPRKAIQLMVKGAGGKVVGSISAKLDVLIAGENAGSKLAKAETLGITIWDEDALDQAFNGKTQSSEIEEIPDSREAKPSQKSLLDF
jgi:DNA ligase (NAD+)